jgi:hypothetical protein
MITAWQVDEVERARPASMMAADATNDIASENKISTSTGVRLRDRTLEIWSPLVRYPSPVSGCFGQVSALTEHACEQRDGDQGNNGEDGPRDRSVTIEAGRVGRDIVRGICRRQRIRDWHLPHATAVEEE